MSVPFGLFRVSFSATKVVHFMISVQCPIPSDLDNAAKKLNGRWVGNSAIYTCSNGYYLDEAENNVTQIMCQPDGVWRIITCITELNCQTGGPWTSFAGSCTSNTTILFLFICLSVCLCLSLSLFSLSLFIFVFSLTEQIVARVVISCIQYCLN